MARSVKQASLAGVSQAEANRNWYKTVRLPSLWLGLVETSTREKDGTSQSAVFLTIVEMVQSRNLLGFFSSAFIGILIILAIVAIAFIYNKVHVFEFWEKCTLDKCKKRPHLQWHDYPELLNALSFHWDIDDT